MHLGNHCGVTARAVAGLLFPMALATWAQAAPFAHTQPASLIRSNSATLGGMVLPNGLPTTAWFQWGATTNYGSLTSTTNVGDGTTVVRLTAPLAGLAVNGAFHFRCVASNANGVAYGADQQWTTGRKLTLWGYNDSGQANLPPGENRAVAVAGGWWHSLAQKPDGTLAVCGSGIYAPLAIPEGLTDVAAIAAGHFHDLALLSNGIVRAWGNNESGQTNVPPGLSNVISAGGGYAFSAALKADGTISFWGANSYGQTNPPAGLSNVVAIAVGGHHVVALRADGTVAAWGLGEYGQTNVPANLSNVVAIAAGYFHSLALQRDGTVVPWGYISWPLTNPPASLSNVVAIAAGGFNSAAVRSDGSLVVLGSNEHGQANVPPLLNPAVGVALGEYHVIALANHSPWVQSQTLVAPTNHDVAITLSGADVNGENLTFAIHNLPTSGDVFQFTTNGRGAPITALSPRVSDVLGRVIFAPVANQTGTPASRFTFVANDGDVDSTPGTVTINFLGTLYAATQPAWVTSVSAAKLNGMVSPNGFTTLVWFEWGDNPSFGQATPPTSAGDGGGMVRVTHALAGLQTNVTYHCRLVASNATGVVYGAHQVFTTGKKVAAWGANSFGETTAPAGLNDATSVAAGWVHSVALRSSGTVTAWGYGSYSGVVTNVPPAATNVVAVSADSHHTLALRADGNVIAWGEISYGYVYVPPELSNVVALASGSDHDVALKADGTVLTWGQYGYNQAVTPAGLSNLIAVAASGNHTLALRADGTVVTWGDNYSGWLTPPAGLTNVVAIADGGSHSLALKLDGTVVAWGDNSFGATNVPAGLSNVVAIACRFGNSLALKADGGTVTWGTSGPTAIPAGLANVAAITGSGVHNLAVGGNVLPTAFPQDLLGAVNQDLVITLSGDDRNGDALNFRIVSLPAAGNLYQFTTNGRGAVITVPNAPVSDPLGCVIFAPVTNRFGTPYAGFDYLANDGSADSAAVGVAIAIIGPTFAFTQRPGPVYATSAAFNGMVTPGPYHSTAWFEWGTDTRYGQTTTATSVGATGDSVHVRLLAGDLALNGSVPRILHCRLVVSNALGVVQGFDQVFTPGRFLAVWGGDYNPAFYSYPTPDLTNLVAFSGNLAIRNDGTLVAWNQTYQTNAGIPAGLTGVVAVAQTSSHSLAVKSDGAVVGWGSNFYGQTNVPPDLTNAIAVAAGSGHSLALKADGRVVAWGQNTYGQTNVPGTLSNVVAIGAGIDHSLALQADGTLTGWGQSDYGQTNVPATMTNVVAISVAGRLNFILRRDGSLGVWGTSYSSYDVLSIPPGLSNAVAITTTGSRNYVIKTDSSVKAWGEPNFDYLNIPYGLSNVVQVGLGLALGNRPAQPLPQTNSGPANFDLVIGLSVREPDYDPVTLKIGTLPAAGSLFQYTLAGRGSAIVSSNTPVSDPLGRVIFAPGANGYGENYASFGLFAHDTWLDSTQAVIRVNIFARPHAVTQPAATVGPTNAMLNGMAVANGFPTSAWFEWGTNAAFGQATAPQLIGVGAQVVRVSASLEGLGSNELIHFRLVASNETGVAYGARQLLPLGRRLTAWGRNNFGQINLAAGLKTVWAINADDESSYALKTDGTVAAFGSGQTNVPAGLSNVIAISSGLALKADGTLAMWGSNYYGETNAPPGLSNVIAIASSGSPSRQVLRADGTVVAWGPNYYGETNVPVGLNNVVAIASGYWHHLALGADGRVTAWGDSRSGETNVPAGLSNVVAIAASASRSLALKADGKLVTWGDNQNGQSSVPSDVTNVIAMAAGYYHNLALQADGNLLVWGYNAYGVTSKPTWLSNATTIVAGVYHSVVLRANQPPVAFPLTSSGIANQEHFLAFDGADNDGDSLSYRIVTLPQFGKLYQYTNGVHGAAITNVNTALTSGRFLFFAPGTNELGNPYDSFTFAATDGSDDSTPVTATISVAGTADGATQPARPVTATSAQLNGMALGNGLPTLAWFEWGTNSNYGQVSAPISVASGSTAVRVSLPFTDLLPGREYHFRIIVTNATRQVVGADQSFKTGGQLTSWGLNTYNLTNIPAGLTNVVAVAGGGTHSLALRTDGTVKAWGGGGVNEGGGAATNVPANLSNVVAIAAGDYFSAALRSNGTVVAWGSGSTQTNVPLSLSNVVDLAAGGAHTLALRSNGTVSAWGNNTYGQTNVPGLGSVVAVAAGATHSLGLRINGQVFAWGNNASRQTSVPAGTTNVVAIAAGGTFSLALRANGTVLAWGSGTAQTNVPAGLSNVVKIAAGGSHSLALKSDGTVVVWGSNTFKQTNAPVGLSNVVSIAAGMNHSLVIGGNLPPWVTNKTVVAYPNHDALVTLSGGDANGDPLTFRVASLPARGALYQYNSGGRGTTIMSPAAPVTDGSARLVFAPAPDELGTPYASFGIVADDGDADSPPATVTLNVILPPTPQLSAAKSGVARFSAPTVAATSLNVDSNGAFGLRFAGYSNLTYQVWASTNLLDWLPLGSAAAASAGWFQFVDADAPNWPQRFYRLSQPGDLAFNLNFSGQSNATYRVWTSTNLENWELLGTANVTSNGWFQFLDFDSARWPQRFYRAGAP